MIETKQNMIPNCALPKNGALFLYSPEVTSNSRCFREKNTAFFRIQTSTANNKPILLKPPTLSSHQSLCEWEKLEKIFMIFQPGMVLILSNIGILILHGLYTALLPEWQGEWDVDFLLRTLAELLLPPSLLPLTTMLLCKWPLHQHNYHWNTGTNT